LKLCDVMSSPVLTVGPATSLRKVVTLFAEQHISGAPVVTAAGDVVGVVATTDVLEFLADKSSRPSASPAVEIKDCADKAVGPVDREDKATTAYFAGEWSSMGDEGEATTPFGPADGERESGLDAHTVSEVMTRRVLSLLSSATVADAAAYLRRARIHRLLVIDNSRLVGIVSSWDVARAVANGSLTERTYVFPRGRSDEAQDHGHQSHPSSPSQNPLRP
jgi:CBS domain-containing protein